MTKYSFIPIDNIGIRIDRNDINSTVIMTDGCIDALIDWIIENQPFRLERYNPDKVTI